VSWKEGTYSSFGGGFSFGLFSNRLPRRSGSSGGLSGANLKIMRESGQSLYMRIKIT
jgi:hypothetical protein